jgi:hypothetical protein
MGLAGKGIEVAEVVTVGYKDVMGLAGKGIEVAEVVTVGYKDGDVESLYFLRCRLLTDKKAYRKDYAPILARPVNANLKIPPIKGELVLLIKAPNNISTKNLQYDEYYYLQTLNLQSSVHHNALPTIGKVEAEGSGGTSDAGASQGAPNQSSDSEETELGDFPENEEIRPLQLYEGDVLFEGRHGQSIRMGSTVTEGTDKYVLSEPQWEAGDGVHGDPITVIRNGQKDDDGFSSKPESNKYILENIDYDKSSIYLTSTQTVAISRASTDDVALNEFGMTNSTDDYTGAQVVIAGDRLIFNAREKEILMFAGGGIALSSYRGIALDSSNAVSLAAGIINLGSDAVSNGEPVVMGEELRKCVAEICDIVDAALQTLIKHVHGYPGTTPSPNGTGDWTQQAGDLAALRTTYGIDQSEDATWHSDFVYVNKDPDYTSGGEGDERKTN